MTSSPLTIMAVSILLLAGAPARGDAESGDTVAIFGDSLATGAASHPALSFDTKSLWRVFAGEEPVQATRTHLPADPGFPLPETLAPPRRLWPTSREFFGGPDWVYRNALQIMSRLYLDTEEYSWGYLAAAGLGVAPERILIAAEDGARVVNMPRHLDRVLSDGGGVLPERLLVLYTGNDLCGMTLEQVTTPDEFEEGLVDGFSYALRNGRPPAGGTDVYLMSYLGILQLLHAEDILGKKIDAFGATVTCRELRESGYRPSDPAYDPGLPPEAWYFGAVMPPNPAAFCPTLFGGGGDDREATISALANRIRDFRVRETRAIEAAKGQAAARGADVRFHHVTATADLVFTAADIAEDCFHLSPTGQAKVARLVIDAVRGP